MGDVFLVEYKDREYALKKINILLFEDVEKVMNEIMIGKLIRNNNLVNYEKVNFAQDKINKTFNIEIIMEFFENGDLCDYLKYRLDNNSIFSQEEVLDYMKQLISAIKSLHSYNMYLNNF